MAGKLNKYFTNLQEIFEEVLRIKNTEGDNEEKMSEMRKRSALQFVVLKKTNRQVKYDLRAGRDDLHRVKQQVDSNQLQLQNLLYEVTHLKREIKRCHKFKSEDEDIELLPEEDYCAIIQPKEIPEGAHAKRLARLEWELELRKKLSEECKTMLNDKKKVLQDIVVRIERLTSFGPSLADLLKATQPLQEALNMPLESEWKVSQLVHMLPQPLYLAFMNLHGLEKSHDNDELQVFVIGSEENIPRNDDIEMLRDELGSLSNDEVDDGAEVVAKKRRHIDRSNVIEELRKRTLEPHPLMVRIVLKSALDKNAGEVVVLLRYFPHLGIMTASSTASLSEADSASADMTLMQDLLRCLFENDQGKDILVPQAEHELNRFGMSGTECVELLNSKEYGRPYRWLQRMCGLVACDAEQELHVRQEKQLDEIALVQSVVQRMQFLWLSRLNLLRQIKALSSKNIEMYLKEEKLPTLRPSCSLVQWTSITWDEYSSDVTTHELRELSMALHHYLFYRAVIVRGSAKMECLITVPPYFPEDNSLWSICIHWNGEHNRCNSNNIKLIEGYINSLEQPMLNNQNALLAAQLLRTMYSFDIYLETESANFSPVEFPKEKHYVRVAAGRIRGKPVKHADNSNENLFKIL